MSEKITEETSQDTSTKWDILAEPSDEAKVEESPVENIETSADINWENADADIDLEDIDLENIDQSGIAKLESKLGGMLAANTREINQYQRKIEQVKKRQLLISNILHGLAELKQLQAEAEEFPFTKKEEAEVPKEETEAPKEEAEPKLSAIEKYEQMLERRVNSGDLKREEADHLFEKAQALTNAKAEEESKPEPEPEKINWAAWGGMAKEDQEAYIAKSRMHDLENLENLAKRNPELADKLRVELGYKKPEKEPEVEEAEPEEEPEEEIPTSVEEPEVEGKTLEPESEPEPEPEEEIEETAETEEAVAEKEQSAEEKALYENLAAEWALVEKIDAAKAEIMSQALSASESVMPEFLKDKNANLKADELRRMIRQDYGTIGGNRGIMLLGSRFEDQNVGSAEYDKWWKELTGEGRKDIAELVEFAEENSIPENATESPISSGFLVWYYGNIKHNGAN